MTESVPRSWFNPDVNTHHGADRYLSLTRGGVTLSRGRLDARGPRFTEVDATYPPTSDLNLGQSERIATTATLAATSPLR